MPKIGFSNTCVNPFNLEESFDKANTLGFDGVEVMVTIDPMTQNVGSLKSLRDEYETEILSLHAPTLLLTPFVLGRKPKDKLERTVAMAAELDVSTVVVHPPFRWQNGYSLNFFEIVENISEEYGVTIAVENMFPWRVKQKPVKAYSPSFSEAVRHGSDITFDFSHAALSGLDTMNFVKKYHKQIKHIHLCDGTTTNPEEKNKIMDEHLLPGQGSQPIVEFLQFLMKQNWDGHIVAEINARKETPRMQRIILKEVLDFTKNALQV